MPPSVQQISGHIQKALLASTDPVFREKDANGVPTNDLPANMKVMVDCISQGIYSSFLEWQASALVNGGTCTPSGPVTGAQIQDLVITV